MNQPDTNTSPPASPPTCPICGAVMNADAATAPFCSARCKMVDLGKWLKGDYVISRDLKDADLEQGE